MSWSVKIINTTSRSWVPHIMHIYMTDLQSVYDKLTTYRYLYTTRWDCPNYPSKDPDSVGLPGAQVENQVINCHSNIRIDSWCWKMKTSYIKLQTLVSKNCIQLKTHMKTQIYTNDLTLNIISYTCYFCHHLERRNTGSKENKGSRQAVRRT